MSKLNLAIVVLLIFATVSCNSFNRADSNPTVTGSPIDFTKLGEGKVVLKVVDPSEMDCKQTDQAYSDLLTLEKMGRSVEIEPKMSLAEYKSKLEKKLLECKGSGNARAYHVEGSSQGAFFKGDICGLDKPFTINVDSKTGKWPMNFTPESDSAGQMEGTFSSNGCTLTGGGPYTISIGGDGSGTITFTYNSTATCPGVPSRTTSKTSTIPLKPATDLKCP